VAPLGVTGTPFRQFCLQKCAKLEFAKHISVPVSLVTVKVANMVVLEKVCRLSKRQAKNFVSIGVNCLR
jgi:hypothetical protein